MRAGHDGAGRRPGIPLLLLLLSLLGTGPGGCQSTDGAGTGRRPDGSSTGGEDGATTGSSDSGRAAVADCEGTPEDGDDGTTPAGDASGPLDCTDGGPPAPDGGPAVDSGLADGGAGPPDQGAVADAAPGTDLSPPDAGSTADAGTGEPSWRTVALEDFEAGGPADPGWSADPCPDDGPYADCGGFFRARGVAAPTAWRISQPFGAAGWLTVEAYSRSRERPLTDLAATAADPAGGTNRVLRLASPAHTDGVLIRPSAPLPPDYRVSLRLGFPSFGDGRPGTNGYDGGETAEPWLPDDATAENGFYWLAILDAQPRPHNNVWIHHHRKVVIDSDNNYPPWMEIWDGQRFVVSGERPVSIFALDGLGRTLPLAGKPFLSWAGGAWQPSGAVRAADSYLPGRWYRVSITRRGDVYQLEISGEFAHGGVTGYTASLDAAAHCVWHYDRQPLPSGSPCLDPASLPGAGVDEPAWPAGRGWPDWFFVGDPHGNYYEGALYLDDLRLEVPVAP